MMLLRQMLAFRHFLFAAMLSFSHYAFDYATYAMPLIDYYAIFRHATLPPCLFAVARCLRADAIISSRYIADDIIAYATLLPLMPPCRLFRCHIAAIFRH